MARGVRGCIFDDSFDAIISPQYLNFDDFVPEAKDSYFEHKKEDDRPAIQYNPIKLKKLPTDSGEDDIRCYEHDIEEPDTEEDDPPQAAPEPETAYEDATKNNGQFVEDVIRSVKNLGVNEAFAEREKTRMVTSTPFRVEGIEPMPWRADPQTAKDGHRTKPRPFYFEERNKRMQQQKARQLQAILEAEKAARKFRANPVPKFLQKTCNKGAENQRSETQTSQSAPPRFRAKSPIVLRRSPFQPVLPKQRLIASQPFVLHTELRAQERAVFDRYVKEKERLDERLADLMKAAQKRREEEETVRIRKQMVPKAQPVRKFKPVQVRMPKRPLTEPSTPRVLKRQRR